jgi:hypothetical protein
MLGRVGEVDGERASVQLMCTHCRDASGDRKIFVIVFHGTPESYTDAIKAESVSTKVKE